MWISCFTIIFYPMVLASTADLVQGNYFTGGWENGGFLILSFLWMVAGILLCKRELHLVIPSALWMPLWLLQFILYLERYTIHYHFFPDTQIVLNLTSGNLFKQAGSFWYDPTSFWIGPCFLAQEIVSDSLCEWN